MGLLDTVAKFVPAGKGEYALDDEERKQIAQQGLLAAGLSIMANNTGNYGRAGPAIGRGLLGGFGTMQTLAQQRQENRYKQVRAERGLDDPAGIREFSAMLSAAGIDPGSDQAKSAARRNLGLEGRASGAAGQIEWGQDAEGNLVARRFNPNTYQLEAFDANSNRWVPLGGAAPTPAIAPPQAQGNVPFGDLVGAVIGQESGGDPNAVSPAGARGLMQVMPGTGASPGFGMQPLQNQTPTENVRFGGEYLDTMLRKYGGNRSLALAAYNAGPGAVDAALEKAGGDPAKAIKSLSAETRAYVPGVQNRLGRGRSKEAEAAAIETAKADVALRTAPQIAAETERAKLRAEREVTGTKAQTSVDTAFGADYAKFIAGEAADASRALEELGTAANTLRTAGGNITGPAISALPYSVRQRLYPKSVDTQEMVEVTVQRSLRAILGAQFTEKEGERLIARAYNPAMPESVNAERVERLLLQLRRAYDNKVRASQYYEKNGTLRGFEGKTDFNVSDFDPGPDTGVPGGGATDQPRRIRIKL